MWVPQEAAELCRRFVRDFDGYRLVIGSGSDQAVSNVGVGPSCSFREGTGRGGHREGGPSNEQD